MKLGLRLSNGDEGRLYPRLVPNSGPGYTCDVCGKKKANHGEECPRYRLDVGQQRIAELQSLGCWGDVTEQEIREIHKALRPVWVDLAKALEKKKKKVDIT